ncbi:uncharacterized protein LOC6644102 isoform X2 [Drosophila willistoni]|uniref:uncharacterized protein LOC6644102 isoform X2 n=1 Tax=Drosophila willistoni TaxID=7260 RepID=UPI001F07B31D|nr:uncharacterized protein LOC6644102 isoform X2 [Drosophila willistoni]
METIKLTTTPTTVMKKMQLLLILFLPMFGQIFGSPLDKRDMELLDMVFRDGDESDISRSQRDLPASSIACDDNSSEEDYPPIFNDEESEEDCLDFLPPIEHPCFMRLILLRSPLLKQDPCANFSIVQDPKLKATKSRKCVKRTKTEIQFSPKVAEQNIVTNSTNNNTTEAIKTTSMESVLLAKSPPNVSKKLAIVPISQEVTNTTEEATTSTDDNSTTTFATTITEEDLTTTTIDPTTTISTSIPTTTIIPTTLSTTGSPNHLKSLRSKSRKRLGKLKGKKGKKPRVPDPPKIKLDAATQPSEVIQVIFTTEVGELKLQANDTTTVSTTTTNFEAETTTEINLIEKTTNQVETTTQETELEEEMETTETEEASTEDPFSFTEEPCNDTDEQDTNLCPQFLTPPEENGHLPSSQLSSVRPAQRQRKVKNYVEPILYEGNFIKPRQRIGLLAQAVPQQRDYYVTNKQIMPRPKPKYRKRLPHSIYMNNIVRGLKCVDAPRPLQPYWGVKRLTSRPYAPLTYNPQRPSPPPSQSPAPFSVPVSIYHQNPNESEEDFGQEKEIVGSKSNYFDDSSSELWQGYGASNSNVDPCQLEHEHLQRRQQHIHKPPYQKVPKDDQQSVDYAHQQQQMPENFFT